MVEVAEDVVDFGQLDGGFFEPFGQCLEVFDISLIDFGEQVQWQFETGARIGHSRGHTNVGGIGGDNLHGKLRLLKQVPGETHEVRSRVATLSSMSST
jgi:hypothetical protein